MATEQDLPKHHHIQIVRGFYCPVPFPNRDFFSKKNLEDTMDYKPRDNDLIIASYPKTGSTWVQYIIMQIISRATVNHSFDDMTHKYFPYLEMTRTAAVEALEGDRIYKHHMPYNLVQKNKKAKFVYTYRHPEDTVVSYYHFYQEFYPEVRIEFNQFFDNFVTGTIAYGSYFKHVLSYYDCSESPNLLMVSYEKLQANRKDEILRIAKFIGEGHSQYLLEHSDILDKIIERTSFGYMKNNLSLTTPMDLGRADKRKINFFRKGIVGDGKNMLSRDQREKIKEAAGILRNTTIYDEWY